MGKYDNFNLATLLKNLVEYGITINTLTERCNEIEQKHKHYEKREDWILLSTRLVSARYQFNEIYEEIFRRCEKND